MKYAIVAAGCGSRLQEGGLATPKPLTVISGVPMIKRIIDILMDNDAEIITVVTNADFPEIAQYLRSLPAEIPLIVEEIHSPNNFYSLYEATKNIEGKFIGMTVDSIFLPSEFKRYVETFAQYPDTEGLMGVTGFIDDEKPLYIEIADDMTITDYGLAPFEGEQWVSAGIYGLSSTIMKQAESNPPADCLNNFQKSLTIKRIPLKGYDLGKVFDVDRPQDIAVADEFIKEHNL